MSKTEKLGADGYSKAAFDAGMDDLQVSGITYQPPSNERKGDTEWSELYEAATVEERRAIDNLDRLYANAKREAPEEDAHREYLEMLPKIEEAKGEINRTLEHVSDSAPVGVINEAREVLDMGDDLAKALKGEKPVPPRSVIQVLVREFITAMKYVLGKLRKWLGGQNKYGDPLRPT